MNKKYIECDTFRKQLVDRQITTQFFNPRERQEIGCIIEMLDNAPTADVVEVKHGKWIDLNITEWQCSECDYRVERWNNTPYCPHCGAKMEE